MTRTARLSLGLLFAAALAPTLAGCGATPLSIAATSSQDQAVKANRPTIPNLDRSALTTAKSGISATSYWTVDRARRSASNALYRYQDLREDWQRAWSDDEKDRIEQRMLNTLVGAGSDIRNITSGSYDYDDRQINYQIESTLRRYEDLRRQWQWEHDLNRQREIINTMLVELTRGLQDVQNFRASRR